jgi:hypothetical protein
MTLAVVPVIALATPAAAATGVTTVRPVQNDTRELTREINKVDGKTIDVPDRYDPKTQADAAAKARAARPSAKAAAPQAAAPAGPTPPVGTVRQWLGLDDFNGFYYRKDYTLRAVGQHIEVWVANDTSFPAGDCRSAADPNSTTVTDAQAQALATEFDITMYPKESAAFSVAPDRDGTNSIIPPDGSGNGGVYTGDGNKTVTLVDNVRDDNYYSFPAAPTYIAGFFSTALNSFFDRNVMTIDAFDWLHRTGANPADASSTDVCASRPARPRLYEGVFAHEYQHLLQSYTDPLESTWLNEGLSDWAQTLVGYVDTRRTVFQAGADSHIFCFQGYGTVQTQFNPNPRNCGGPENSLTGWGDQGDSEILADYGNAYSFVSYLFDRYGQAFISALHRDGTKQGLASVAAELAKVHGRSLWSTIHDFQTTVLVDGIVSKRGGQINGINKNRVTTASLTSTVNLLNDNAYATPGAPYNGADYVPLRGRGTNFLAGKDLRSLSFNGSATLPSQPLNWTVVSDDPDRAGNPVLWSGNSSNLDASAVVPVTVPAADPTLSFLAKYGAEEGFDYAYVLVSTDGGKTYTPLSSPDTVTGPLGPALNGSTVGFQPRTFDLSAYAGKSILLGFRYVSDGGVNEGGLKVDDITVAGTTVSDGSSLAQFKTITGIQPVAIYNWNLRLVGIDEAKGRAEYAEYDGVRSLSLTRNALERFRKYPIVVAIVAYDEPTEQVQQYARYTLTVNGVTQAGG